MKYSNDLNVNQSRVDTSKDYQILEEVGKLKKLFPLILLIPNSLLLFNCGIILLYISYLDAIIILVIASIVLVTTIISLAKNFSKIKNLRAKNKMIKNGTIFIGEIIESETKLFDLGKKVIYIASLKIKFIDKDNQTVYKNIKEEYPENRKFCTGQKIFLCNYLNNYLLIDCEILNNNLLSNQIKQENQRLFEDSHQEDIYDDKLKNNYNRSINNLKLKPIIKYFKISNLLILIMLSFLLSIIIFMATTIIKYNHDNLYILIKALILLSIFGSSIIISFIITVIIIIKGLILMRKDAKFIEGAIYTIGYIFAVDERFWYEKTRRAHRTVQMVVKARRLVNYKFKKNSQSTIITKSFKMIDSSEATNIFKVGEEIAIFYDDQKEVIMKINQ